MSTEDAGTQRSGCDSYIAKRICAAMKRNFVPGLVLNTIGLIIVIIYYSSDKVADAFEALGEFKKDAGFAYSCVSTFIFGAFIPFFIVLLTQPKNRTKEWMVPNAIFLTIYWSYRGIEVDAFYRFQAYLFGSESNFQTIAPKVAIDQFMYSPLWATWWGTMWFQFKDKGFSFARLRAENGLFSKKWWIENVLVVQSAGWCVWIPGCSLIYALPSALQIPLFNIVLCFWVLIMFIVAAAEKKAERGDQLSEFENPKQELRESAELNAGVDQLKEEPSGDLPMSPAVATHRDEVIELTSMSPISLASGEASP